MAIDHNVTATERGINDAIDANERACAETAAANGFTADQAENCEEGELRCAGCPWNQPEGGKR